MARLVRGDQNRDDRRHDEYQDHENEADHHSAHRPPAQVGAGDPSYYPQHAVELLVPQVRATAISPATCRIRDIGRHGLSMGVATVLLPVAVDIHVAHARSPPARDPYVRICRHPSNPDVVGCADFGRRRVRPVTRDAAGPRAALHR